MPPCVKNCSRTPSETSTVNIPWRVWPVKMKKYMNNSYTKTETEVTFTDMEYNRFADIKRLQFIVDALKKNVPTHATVLDVGCGNGIISRGIGAEGFNVYGIDVSEKAIEK